jgi:simple sugar transport system permease protein
LTIFGSFRPERIFLGAFLFSGVETFAYRLVLTPGVPYQFFLMLPFVAVLIVMTVFYRVIEYPAAIGRPYSRE